MSDQQGLPPNYFHHQLPNGLQMIGQYMPSLSSVSFGFQLDAAVVHEPEDKNGLAHLFEYMLFQGTRQKDARALNEAFESLGARKGASTSIEAALIWSQVINKKFDQTLDLFHEILLTPTFPCKELEQMRNLVFQEIRRRDDEPMSRIFELVRSKFYQGTPLGRSVLGTNTSLQTVQHQDIHDFWQTRYCPNNVLFTIAGKFDWDHVVKQVEAHFGDWAREASSTPTFQLNPTTSVTLEYREGKQEHLALMCPFPKYTDPDYYAATVIAEALGGNMTSRLFVEVREKRGLVYGVSANLASNKHTGSLRIYAGTTPTQGRECLRVITSELEKLTQEGITKDELERAKIQLKSEHVMRGEGSASRMSANARSWWYERRIKTIQEVQEKFDAVSQEQVLRVLQRFCPTNGLTIVGIGPLTQEDLVDKLV